MSHPTSIVLIFDPNFEQLLMLRRVKNTFGFDWGYVAGKSDGNETPLETAVREMREEIGVEQNAGHVLPLSEFDIHMDTKQFTVFVTTIPIDTPLTIAEKEIHEYKWFPLAQLPESRPKEEDQIIQRVVAFIQPLLQRPYRQNVQFWCFRNDGKILILDESKEDEIYWKFPQGGKEGNETNEETIQRELMEELHVHTFQIIGKSSETNRYNWPPSLSRTRTYRGQEQSVYLVYLPKPEEVKPNPAEGIKAVEWMTFDEAMERFKFLNQKMVAKKTWKEFAPIVEKRVKEVGTFTRSAFRPTVQMWAFNSKKEILLVNETNRINLKRKSMNQETLPEYWLIPQGGIKWRIHEKAEDAARRELEEETNLKTIQIVHVSPKKHNVPHQFIVKGYEGGAEIIPVLIYCPKPNEAKFNLEENQEIAWVPLEKVVEKLTIENQKESAKQTMKEFAPIINEWIRNGNQK